MVEQGFRSVVRSPNTGIIAVEGFPILEIPLRHKPIKRTGVDRHFKVGFPRCPPGESGTRDLLASYGEAGISPRAEEGKINLLTHQTDVVYSHARTVTQTVGLTRILPSQAKTFWVIVKIIGQPADVHQTLDEEVVE